GGLKESLRRLKDQEMLVIFPEGTRTRDGEVGALKGGFLALARRAKAPLLPVALDGAFESWPRGNLLPLPAVIQIRFAAPLAPETMSKMSDEELLAEVNCRIRQSHALLRESRHRAMRSLDSHPSSNACCQKPEAATCSVDRLYAADIESP